MHPTWSIKYASRSSTPLPVKLEIINTLHHPSTTHPTLVMITPTHKKRWLSHQLNILQKEENQTCQKQEVHQTLLLEARAAFLVQSSPPTQPKNTPLKDSDYSRSGMQHDSCKKWFAQSHWTHRIHQNQCGKSGPFLNPNSRAQISSRKEYYLIQT